MTGVTGNTTLVTMGSPSRLEDVSLILRSSGHYALTGIAFGGTTATDAKLRGAVLTVDNSTASVGGTSNVYGMLCSGTGILGPASSTFNITRGCTINVLSNGGGNKRGVIITNANITTLRDTNIYVAAPTNTASLGSYVGVETNDTVGPNLGSIQMRTTTVVTTTPTIGQAYSASDILQTTPATVGEPTYLASPGIQIGPGTDLVSKTAGSRGFSTFVYPTTIYYALKGAISAGTSGWLWPGTQAVTAGGIFPDATGTVGNIFLQVSETRAGANNDVTVTSTTGLAVNMPVVFNTSIGNIVAGTVYYIYEVRDLTHFRISTTVNGAIFVQVAATASVTANAYSTLIVTASAVNASNQITLDTVADIAIGMPIVFSELLGNLVPGTPYYVDTIGLTYITVSALPGGAVFTTGVATGSSPAIVNTVATLVSSVAGTTITVSHSDGIAVGVPIVFAANIGNIVQGTIYYVKTILNRFSLNISTVPGGPAFAVGTATASVRANIFNYNSPPAYFRIQQPTILSGINVAMSSPANLSGTAVTVQFSIYRTPAGANLQTGISPIAAFFITFNDSTTVSKNFYNSSKTFGGGDRIHVYLSYFGGVPTSSDVSVQLDLF
jgi:hypothetical protein